MAPPVLDTLSGEIFTELRICDEFLGFCSRPKYETLEISDFQARVLADKPAEIQDDMYVNNLYAQIYADPEPRRTLTMLHLSDMHIDLEYKEGTAATCDSIFCCREEFGYPTDPSQAAGKWGSFQCDLPVVTLQHLL